MGREAKSAPLARIRTEEDRVAIVANAAQMLAQARTPVEAKRVHDLAKAAETYARLQKVGEEAVSHARAIAVDALALMGEMLKATQKNTGTAGKLPPGPGRGKKNGSTKVEPPFSPTPTLADSGITKKES